MILPATWREAYGTSIALDKEGMLRVTHSERAQGLVRCLLAGMRHWIVPPKNGRWLRVVHSAKPVLSLYDVRDLMMPEGSFPEEELQAYLRFAMSRVQGEMDTISLRAGQAVVTAVKYDHAKIGALLHGLRQSTGETPRK